jgi:hypothetical protein
MTIYLFTPYFRNFHRLSPVRLRDNNRKIMKIIASLIYMPFPLPAVGLFDIQRKCRQFSPVAALVYQPCLLLKKAK